MVEYSSELHETCFPFLAKEETTILLSVMESLEIKAGALLYQAHEAADCLYILVSGKIAVQKETGFGDRMQVVALLYPGAPLGESGLLVGQSRGAKLTAVTDSRLLLLPQRRFEQISNDKPALAVKVLTWLMSRLILRLQKSTERLAHVL